jgi:hypothetical protein
MRTMTPIRSLFEPHLTVSNLDVLGLLLALPDRPRPEPGTVSLSHSGGA